jgi:hypothetical protein
MRTVTLYEYDRQLSPGTIGVDFESSNINENYTLQYEPDEPDEADKLMRTIVEWIKEAK